MSHDKWRARHCVEHTLKNQLLEAPSIHSRNHDPVISQVHSPNSERGDANQNQMMTTAHSTQLNTRNSIINQNVPLRTEKLRDSSDDNVRQQNHSLPAIKRQLPRPQESPTQSYAISKLTDKRKLQSTTKRCITICQARHCQTSRRPTLPKFRSLARRQARQPGHN